MSGRSNRSSIAQAVVAIAAFIITAPPVDAILFLCLYAGAKGLIIREWNMPLLGEVLESLPDIYTLAGGAALLAGILVALRARSGATTGFIISTGFFIGLANAVLLITLGPDFGQREIPVVVLVACHAFAFAVTALVSAWIARLLSSRLVGASS